MSSSPAGGPTDPGPSDPSPTLPPPQQPPTKAESAGFTEPTIDEADLFPTIPSVQAASSSLPFNPQCPVLPSRFGTYILELKIDAGGMGVVYKARQLFNLAEPSMSRVVALKMILPDRLGSAQVVKRFLAEAHSAAQLDYHPNIVQIYDVGEIDGLPYFSMQYVGGGSLQQIVDEQFILPPQISARVVRKVADAVHSRHTEARIIHRDIKPSNILLGRDTESEGEINLDQAANEGNVTFTRWAPKLTDFGLARNADSGLTMQGEVMGTPSFMPPEQARGDLDRIGPPSDVYSLGAVLYALLTGRPPFEASTSQATITRLLHDDPTPPRLTEKGKATPPDLELICLKCLEKDPSRRYDSARALAEDLDRYLAGEPIVAKPPQPMSLIFRKVRRRARQLVGVAIVLTCLALVAGFILRDRSTRREQLRQEQLAYQKAIETVQNMTARVRSRDFNAREWERDLDESFDRLKRLPEDAAAGRAGARACYKLAVQLYEQGFKESSRAARTAREVCDKLSDAGSFDEEDRLLRVEARLLLGRSAVDKRRFSDAAEQFKQALDDLDDCTSEKREVILKKAEVYHRQGEMYNAQPDRKLAVDAYEELIRLRKQLTSHRKYSETAARDYFNDLARGYGYLGDTFLDLGEPERAEKAYNAAEVIRAALHKEFPNNTRTRQQLARSHWNTGLLRLRQNKGIEAIEALTRAAETFQDLVDSSDGYVAEFREDLAYTSLDLAEALLDYGADPDERRRAEKVARTAENQFGELLKADPNAPSLLRDRIRAKVDVVRCVLTGTGDEAQKQEVQKQLDLAERKLRELEERKEGREEPTTSYLLAVLESMHGEVTSDQMKRGLCLVNVSNRLGEAIKHGFANAEQIDQNSRLRLFREQRGPDLRILVEKCRTKRRSGMDR